MQRKHKFAVILSFQGKNFSAGLNSDIKATKQGGSFTRPKAGECEKYFSHISS